MNDLNEMNQPESVHNPQQAVVFCQSCGRGLQAGEVRRVGTAVYCEPCMTGRGADAANGGGPMGSYAGGAQRVYGGTAGPSPGLAFLLGLIPGVGAMYNEQYVKGIVHLAVFAGLVVFANISAIFGMFVAGWVFYMAIEAHHTAKARRDGTPLPNPFGFNDLGERMGFGKAWPGSPDVAGATRDAVNAATQSLHAAAAGFQQRPGAGYEAGPIVTPRPTPTDPTADAWGAPVNANAGGAYPTAPYPTAPYSGAPYSTAPYSGAPQYPADAGYTAPYTNQPYAGVYEAPQAGGPPMLMSARFPVGAVWLIGLGLFFLLSTLGIFSAVSGTSLLGLFLLALGIWNFVRSMLRSGPGLLADGTRGYAFRVVRALRGSVWLVLIGFLFLLDSFHLFRWKASWPVFLILAGVLMLLERAAQNAVYRAGAAEVQPSGSGTDEGRN